MKKLTTVITTVLLMACATAAFTGCSKSKKTASAPAAAAKDEFVIFDPATTSVDVGEVVKVGNESFLKVTVEGYGTTIAIPAVDCNGKSTFEAVCYVEEPNPDLNLTVALKDETYADISNPAMYQVIDTPTTITAGNAEKQPWNTLSETQLCAVIQPMVQDSTNGYKEQYGVVIYIGKITAK